MLLPGPHQKGVELIEETGIGGERRLEYPAQRVVRLVLPRRPVPGQDAAGVGIDHEDRTAGRI